ncbi:MAG: pantetheine-phosphate adenylyltransferase [Panacagrimonas sp.]
MPVVAAYSGTFDPITLGHEDIMRRAARMFDTLIVAVGSNLAKTPMFTEPERIQLIRDTILDVPNIGVRSAGERLLVDFARDNGVTVIVRGVRSVADLEFEESMAVMNRQMYPDVDTVMLLPSPEFAHLSSSRVRELARFGTPLDRLVPAAVLRALLERPKAS